MRKKNNGIISVSDIIFAAGIAVTCIIVFLCFFTGADADTVVISQNGETVYELPLGEDSVTKVGGKYSNTVIIENGCVRVEDSTCPNHVCEKTVISAANECIVCAPNCLTVSIKGEGEVDAVTK